MPVRPILCCTLLVFWIAGAVAQQNTPSAAPEPAVPQLLPGSARPAAVPAVKPEAAPPQTVALTVTKGTSLQIALEQEVRIKRVGQGIQGVVVEPVYAFDRLVVPKGSKVRGEVTKIEPISNTRRTLAGLDGDFTPARQIELRFTDLALADGTHISLSTNVTAGSGQILKFVASPDENSKKSVKDAASEKANEAKQQARPMGQRDEAVADARPRASPYSLCGSAIAGAPPVHSHRNHVLCRTRRTA